MKRSRPVSDAAATHKLLAGLSLMLMALNLRPALTSVGPLLTRIAAETGIGTLGASLLTTLPVLCLGIAGAAGPWTIRRLGIDAGLLSSIAAVTAGLALRGIGEPIALFAGSGLAACGIGLAAVLVPALIKRDFAAKAGVVTGAFTMMLCLGAAAGAGLSVPILQASGWGWAGTLAFWALPALIATVAWAPFGWRTLDSGSGTPGPRPRLLKDPLAWQVTGFMGLQSSLAYIQFGWLPTLLQDRGMSALEAGFAASIVTLGQAPGALIVATLAARARDQRGWIVTILLTTLISFLAMVFGPAWAMLPAGIVFGIALGGCFGLGLTLIVLRAPDTAHAGALSAMAQSIGYAIASLGPLGFGLAHDASGGWVWSAALFAAIALASLACGLGAGRNLHVGGKPQAARGP